MRALIVNGSKNEQEILKKMLLETKKIESIRLVNGFEGTKVAKWLMPDLVFIFLLPQRYQEIEDFKKRTKSKIIAIGEIEDLIPAMEKGAKGFILRPLKEDLEYFTLCCH